MNQSQGVKDDPGIGNEVVLWRRIRESDILWPTNEADDVRPKKSPCFADSPDRSPLSMTMADESGMTPEEYLAGYPEKALVMVTVGQIRAEGLGVTKTPTNLDPAHVSIHGKKTGSIKKKLAINCKFVILP